MSNRMFIGHRINSHPVRGSQEAKNIIVTGTIEMNDEKICLWQNDYFTGEDLRRYFDEDTMHQLTWDAMLPTEHTYCINKLSITQKSFALDMETLARNWGFDKTAQQIVKNKMSAPGHNRPL